MSNSAYPQQGGPAHPRQTPTETETSTKTEPTPLTVRLLDALGAAEQTTERAHDEPFEFRVVAPMLVEVTNAKYDPEIRAAHRYTVTIAEEDDLFVPIHCSCPAYHYRRDSHGACKHMVATVLCGGPPLLGAAAVYTGRWRDPEDDPERDVTTAADLLTARDSA